MIKKTITYTDYNGSKRTEDFFFNLSKAELIDMEFGVYGGYSEAVKKIVDSNDTPSIMKCFKEIILKAYGKKTDDGRRFIKSEELSKEFEQTEAYSEMIVDFIQHPDVAAEFIRKVMPSDIAEEAMKNPNHPALKESRN